ncbi:MAG: TM2 domain-containing protein [Nocardioidaceae bacterium]
MSEQLPPPEDAEPTAPLPPDPQPAPPSYEAPSQPGPPPGPQAPPPGYQAYPPQYYVDPNAPFGVHPLTGIPYSDKSKIVAGILQILLPFGIGRFYIGDTSTGVIQLVVTLVTCGIGSLWSVIDGIIMLVTDSKDAHGRMLRS